MTTNDAKLLRKVLSKGNIPPDLLKLDEQTRYEITTLLLEVVAEARSDNTNQIFKELDKEQYVASDPIMGDSTLLDTGDILLTKEEYQALKKQFKVD